MEIDAKFIGRFTKMKTWAEIVSIYEIHGWTLPWQRKTKRYYKRKPVAVPTEWYDERPKMKEMKGMAKVKGWNVPVYAYNSDDFAKTMHDLDAEWVASKGDIGREMIAYEDRTLAQGFLFESINEPEVKDELEKSGYFDDKPTEWLEEMLPALA